MSDSDKVLHLKGQLKTTELQLISCMKENEKLRRQTPNQKVRMLVSNIDKLEKSLKECKESLADKPKWHPRTRKKPYIQSKAQIEQARDVANRAPRNSRGQFLPRDF